eukprot:scaffold10.g2292.t1
MGASPTSPLAPGLEVAASASDDSEPEEARRLRALVACRALDTPAERRYDSICTLLQSIFNAPMALVSLIDSDSLFFKSFAGGEAGTHARRIHSFCDASLKAPNPTMMVSEGIIICPCAAQPRMGRSVTTLSPALLRPRRADDAPMPRSKVVPDTLEDARFQASQFVAGPPYVRFYCGAPLVSSDGYVMGSLGALDVKPRAFPAELCNVICNFAELVVREMEKEKAAAAAAAASNQAAAEAALRQGRAMAGAVRALSVFSEAVLLCDTAADGFPLLYCNDAWAALAGADVDACIRSSFLKLCPLPDDGGAQLAAARAAIQQHRPFSLQAKCGCLGGAGLRRVAFKPATHDHLGVAGQIPLIGIPNFVAPATDEELGTLPLGYYFAIAEPLASDSSPVPSAGTPPGLVEGHTPGEGWTSPSPVRSYAVHSGLTGSSSPWSMHSFNLDPPEALGELELGPLLGSGAGPNLAAPPALSRQSGAAHGWVYRASWHGHPRGPVAVKVLDAWVDADDPWPEHAAEPRGDLLRRVPALEAALSSRVVHPNLGLDGWKEAEQPEENMAPQEHRQCWIVQEYLNHGTLLDAVDRGWLRTRRGLDGPIDARKLLLTARDIAAGLACLHEHNVLHSDLSGNNVLLDSDPRDPRGFVAKPRELLGAGELSKATDVYSYGVLLWEMYCGEHAWCGMRPTQIYHLETTLGQELEVPQGCPPGFKALVEACLAGDPSRRPSMRGVLQRIEAMVAAEA